MAMHSKRILIIEDETSIRDMLCFALERADYRVASSGDVPAARMAIAEARPDLILLGLDAAGGLRHRFARELKTSVTTRDIPVIMSDRALGGRRRGARPQHRVRRLRLQAVFLSPSWWRASRRCCGGPCRVGKRRPWRSRRSTGRWRQPARDRQGEPVRLGPTEYRLLHFFISHPERVYTREQVLDRVWGQNVYVEERTVDVHIRRLRKALAPFGYDAMIQTVRGTGYRFSEKL